MGYLHIQSPQFLNRAQTIIELVEASIILDVEMQQMINRVSGIVMRVLEEWLHKWCGSVSRQGYQMYQASFELKDKLNTILQKAGEFRIQFEVLDQNRRASSVFLGGNADWRVGKVNVNIVGEFAPTTKCDSAFLLKTVEYLRGLLYHEFTHLSQYARRSVPPTMFVTPTSYEGPPSSRKEYIRDFLGGQHMTLAKSLSRQARFDIPQWRFRAPENQLYGRKDPERKKGGPEPQHFTGAMKYYSQPEEIMAYASQIAYFLMQANTQTGETQQNTLRLAQIVVTRALTAMGKGSPADKLFMKHIFNYLVAKGLSSENIHRLLRLIKWEEKT